MPRQKEDRTKFSSTMQTNLYQQILKLSEETQIPVTRLIDQAVKLLLKSHKKKEQ